MFEGGQDNHLIQMFTIDQILDNQFFQEKAIDTDNTIKRTMTS